jgi:hypothetical protein
LALALELKESRPAMRLRTARVATMGIRPAKLPDGMRAI